MKRSIFVLVLVLSLALPTLLWAQEAKEPFFSEESEPPQTVTLTNMGCAVALDSFGRTTNYNVAAPCGNVMFEHIDYVSVNNGPVRIVAPPNFTIVSPITATGNTATSTVSMGALTITFNHFLGPPTSNFSSCEWVTSVDVSSNNPNDTVCYYSYTDYDVIAFRSNAGDFIPEAGQGQGFFVRNCPQQNCRVWFYSDSAVNMSDRFDQRAFPVLRNAIAGFQSCVNLNNAPPTLGSCPQGTDWTGAIQWGASGSPRSLPLNIQYGHEREIAPAP